MSDRDLLRYFLKVRMWGVVALTASMTVFGAFLVLFLGSTSNDSLNTVLGTIVGGLGAALGFIAHAVARDVTEHIERMRDKPESGDNDR